MRRQKRRWKLAPGSSSYMDPEGLCDQACTLRLSFLMSKLDETFLSCFPHKAVLMNHRREEKQFTQHVCNRKWRFANGRPFVFSEQGRQGFVYVRQKVGAAAELNCSANRKEEAEMPEGKYRK